VSNWMTTIKAKWFRCSQRPLLRPSIVV